MESKIVADLEKDLREVPPDQACLILERISEIGPKGSPALARALSHPDDAVFSRAYQVLWRRVKSWSTQPTGQDEIFTTIRELNRTFPQLVPDRQKAVTELIVQFLTDYRQSGKSSVTIIQLCEPMLLTQTNSSQQSGQDSSRPEIQPISRGEESLATVLRFQSSGLPDAEKQDKRSFDGSERQTPQELRTEPLDEVSRDWPPPPAVVDRWQLPSNELTAWKEVIAAPVAQLTIYEENLESSQTGSRSFGPGGLALSLAGPQEEGDGWKTANSNVVERHAEMSTGDNLDGPPQNGETSPRPHTPRVADISRSKITPAPKRIDLTTLEPLFSRLSGKTTDAEQARQTLLSLGLNADMIEAGRMAFHPSAEFRRQAVKTIWHLSGIDPLPFLFRLAKDSDTAVRREALAVLATMNNPTVRAFVRDAVSHDGDPQIRGLLDQLDSGIRENDRTTSLR